MEGGSGGFGEHWGGRGVGPYRKLSVDDLEGNRIDFVLPSDLTWGRRASRLHRARLDQEEFGLFRLTTLQRHWITFPVGTGAMGETVVLTGAAAYA